MASRVLNFAESSPAKRQCQGQVDGRILRKQFTVRQTSGQFTVTDGPFAETKEVIWGLAILKADSKEQAVEYTKQFLSYAGADGECEVRQLHEASSNADCQPARAHATTNA